MRKIRAMLREPGGQFKTHFEKSGRAKISISFAPRRIHNQPK
jgi:hypothetical protein